MLLIFHAKIFELKCTKMRLAAGLCPDPLGSSQRSPRPPSCVWGGATPPPGKGREREREEGRRRETGEGREMGKRGEEGRGRECAPPIFTGAPHFLIPGVAPVAVVSGGLINS